MNIEASEVYKIVKSARKEMCTEMECTFPHLQYAVSVFWWNLRRPRIPGKVVASMFSQLALFQVLTWLTWSLRNFMLTSYFQFSGWDNSAFTFTSDNRLLSNIMKINSSFSVKWWKLCKK